MNYKTREKYIGQCRTLQHLREGHRGRLPQNKSIIDAILEGWAAALKIDMEMATRELQFENARLANQLEDTTAEGIRDDANAWIQANISGRTAGIFINEDAECHKSDNDIRKSAFHEVLELLFWEYEDICTNSGTRFATDKVRGESIESARHAVLRRIENGIFSNIGAWE